MADRIGVTPIITMILLTGMILGMGLLTYQFLQEQQDRVVRTTEQPVMETVNMSCDQAFISWWIRNNVQHGIDNADIFIRERGASTDTLVLRDVTPPPEIRSGQEISEFPLSLPNPLDRGTLYDITLETDRTSLESSCLVGESWWDYNWDYRRQVQLQPANIGADGATAIQLNASQLVSEQKLQPRCQDIRTVIGQQAVPHNVSAPGACASTEQINVTFDVPDYTTASGRTYVYYGNLQAGIEPPWLQHIDITYIADTSESMFNEWNTLEATIADTNDDINQYEQIDLDTTLLGLNNTYNGDTSDERVCQSGQSLPPPLHCNRTGTAIDGITDMDVYLDWINTTHTAYTPQTQPDPEAPSEGWGMGALDVIEHSDWRDAASRILVTIGDHDTTGGACGDNRSEALAGNLTVNLSTHDISMYALMATPECSDDPGDGIHNTTTARQMNMTGTLINYSNADQLSNHIINDHYTPLSTWPLFNDLGPEERINIPG